MDDFTPVILESPYAGTHPDKDSLEYKLQVLDNVEYARVCMRDCLARGEAPFASHLLYTQPGVLDDTSQGERDRGIAAGFAFRRIVDATVVYTDRGVSPGMVLGIRHALAQGCAVVPRALYGRVPTLEELLAP